MTTQERYRSGFADMLARGGVAVVAVGLALSMGAGTASGAAGLDATPMPPAVIDEDGTQNLDTSSYPAEPSYPAAPMWPGDSSMPCCSR